MLHAFSFRNDVVKHFAASVYILTQVYKNESVWFPMNGNRSTARCYEYYFVLSFLMRFILRPDSLKTEILLAIECRLQIARYSTWKGARLIDSLCVCVCVCAALHTQLSAVPSVCAGQNRASLGVLTSRDGRRTPIPLIMLIFGQQRGWHSPQN